MDDDATGPDLDLLAASLRADAGDIDAYFESLAAKLEEVLPGRTKVERRRQGMLGPKQIRRLSVDTADQRLELARGDHGRIEARRGRVSGGIVLKTDELDPDQWTAALSAALAAEAQRSETTRRALERLLMG